MHWREQVAHPDDSWMNGFFDSGSLDEHADGSQHWIGPLGTMWWSRLPAHFDTLEY